MFQALESILTCSHVSGVVEYLVLKLQRNYRPGERKHTLAATWWLGTHKMAKEMRIRKMNSPRPRTITNYDKISPNVAQR